MKFTEKEFPILGCVKNNLLNNEIHKFIERQVSDKKEQDDIRLGLNFFNNQHLQINYVSKAIHAKLINTSNFIKAKKLLKGSPKATGLLLLPETLLPDFSMVSDYIKIENSEFPINAILYRWLDYNEYDQLMGYDVEEDDYWEDPDARELFIMPIYEDGTTCATKTSSMSGLEDIYGDDYSDNGREWYGKIHDYVMSFILFYNYTETETKILHAVDSGKQRRAKVGMDKFANFSENNVEIIDTTYFTKIIHSGEFPVDGHFRVQHYGPGASKTKIIYVDSYMKNGYSRGARIDNK